MRHGGGHMLRHVRRRFSQQRPSSVVTEPCITHDHSPGLFPSLREHLQRCSSTLGSSGIDDSKRVETLQSIRQNEASLCLSQQRRGFGRVGDGDEESDLTRHYEESLVIGYSPEQLYAVVAAVDLYEDFVPWCQRSSVIWQKDHEALEAELEIGFRFINERYISHVVLKKPHLVKTSVSQSSLFEHLINEWEFKPGPTPHSTNLHFLVDFQFRSPLYRKVANMFFTEVVKQLVGSFENRCRAVYGPSLHVIQSEGEHHAKSDDLHAK